MTNKALEASFEEMSVASTTYLPLTTVGGQTSFDGEAPPRDKITFLVEILFKDHVTKKAVRILPAQSMHDFIDKLNKKKYMPSTSALGGVPLRSEYISVAFGKDYSYTVPLTMDRWDEPLWSVGFREKDLIIVKVDPTAPPAVRKTGSAHESQDKEKNKDKHMSFIDRLTRKSVKTETPRTESPAGMLFGLPIQDVASLGVPLMADYAIPAFIDEGLSFIRQYHTETEGIFRLSGSLTEIKALKRKIDQAAAPPFDPDVDVHCLAGLIKLYLRELPEPLLTFRLYECWKSVSECEVKEKKHELVKALLLALPRPNYCLLTRLVKFFADLSTFERTTKMGLVNLATLIGPNLIWSPEKDSNDISTPMKITWFMLSNFSTLFEDAQARSTILLSVGKAKYDFEPETGEEIRLSAGDIVFVTANDQDDQGWLEGMVSRSHEHGKFPSKYFGMVASFVPAERASAASGTSSPSLVASSAQLEALTNAVEELRKELAAETAARTAVETRIEGLQTNFNDMVQIMLTLKNRVKELRAIVEELDVYEEGAPPA